MAMPSGRRNSLPSPRPIASGRAPNSAALVVIMIGRKRRRPLCRAWFLVATVNTHRPLFWFLGRGEVKSMDDLRGRRLAIHEAHTAPGCFARMQRINKLSIRLRLAHLRLDMSSVDRVIENLCLLSNNLVRFSPPQEFRDFVSR
jgi:hypothetical protein